MESKNKKMRQITVYAGKILCILAAAILLWIIGGSLIMSARYPTLSEETFAQFCEEDFYGTPEEYTNDRVMLIEHNMDALIHRLRLIDEAKERIILSTFDMRSDESGTDMLAALLAASERGVRIQIIADGMPGFLRMTGNKTFLALESRENVEIKLYNPLSIVNPEKMHCRLHDKYLVIDNTYCILGGRNTYDYFLGAYDSEHENRDREILTFCETGESETIRQVTDYFEKIWNEDCSKELNKNADQRAGEAEAEREMLQKHYQALKKRYPQAFENFDYQNETVPARKIVLISGSTAPEKKEPVVLETLTRLMENAGESVILHTPYAVCDRYMLDCLRRAGSGGNVTLLVNRVLSGGNLPASGDYLWHRKDFLETGMSLFEYNGGKSYHGKSVLIDHRLAIVGSFNYDMRSVYLDTELMLAVDSEEFAALLGEEMEEAQNLSMQIPAESGNLAMLKGEAPLLKKVEIVVMAILAPIIRRLV